MECTVAEPGRAGRVCDRAVLDQRLVLSEAVTIRRTFIEGEKEN